MDFESYAGARSVLVFASAFLALAAVLYLLAGDEFLSPVGYIIGDVLTSVSVMPELNSIFYEGNAGNVKDNTFQIGPVIADNSWHSYNGTYDSMTSGYDIGIDSNNNTEFFDIENTGTTSIDMLIASSDFDNGIISDGNYIDVNQSGGDLQVYIPGIGWKDVPDNSNKDDDGYRNTEELCIADNLEVGGKIEGIDFRIRARNGLSPGNYTAHIITSVFESNNLNPCFGAGEYVRP